MRHFCDHLELVFVKLIFFLQNLGFDMFIYFGTSAIHFILNGDERDVRKFR